MHDQNVGLPLLPICVTEKQMDSIAGHSAVQSPAVFCQFASCDQDIIGQKMQFTGWDNANNMRNATRADTQTSIKCPYKSLYFSLSISWGFV